MRKPSAVTAGAAMLAALACVAVGQAAASGAPTSGARTSAARTAAAARASTASSVSAAGATSRRWPVRTVLREPPELRISNQAIDPRARVVYALSGNAGPLAYQLIRLPLSGGPGQVGAVLPVNGIAVGAGSVWVFGAGPAAHSAFSLVLYQVSPATLAVRRSWTLSPGERRSGFVGFAAGGGGTVWVGFLRTILRINASSGAIVSRIRIASGLTVSDVAVDPAGRHLYVMANTPLSGTEVVEYAAATGRRLASNARGALRFSVGGASATAVPGAVWVSFRTGSLGETVLLRQEGLRFVKLPGSGHPGSLFNWVLFANTEYAGTALFLARQDGIIGCLSPRSGQVRARGVVRKLIGAGNLLGAARAGRVLYGLSQAGVVAISPPAACLR